MTASRQYFEVTYDESCLSVLGDPADDDVGAGHVAAEGEGDADPSRGDDLELKRGTESVNIRSIFVPKVMIKRGREGLFLHICF